MGERPIYVRPDVTSSRCSIATVARPPLPMRSQSALGARRGDRLCRRDLRSGLRPAVLSSAGARRGPRGSRMQAPAVEESTRPTAAGGDDEHRSRPPSPRPKLHPRSDPDADAEPSPTAPPPPRPRRSDPDAPTAAGQSVPNLGRHRPGLAPAAPGHVRPDAGARRRGEDARHQRLARPAARPGLDRRQRLRRVPHPLPDAAHDDDAAPGRHPAVRLGRDDAARTRRPSPGPSSASVSCSK